MDLFWFLIYCTSAFFIFLFLPFGIFFYETDEEKEFKWRLWTAVKYELFVFIISLLVIMCTYAGLRFADLPVVANTCSSTQTPSIFEEVNSVNTESLCVSTDQTLEIVVSFPVYLIALVTFIGWFFLMVFLGAGLIALPLDLINEWRFRPRPMKEDEFTRTKQELAQKVDVLLQKGKKLLDDKVSADKKTGCGGYRERRTVRRNLSEFEANCILVEKEFNILDDTRQYNKKVEPMWYAMKLILGILAFIFSLILVIHLFVYVLLKVDGKSVGPFLNALLEKLENSSASFLATLLFSFIGFYLMFCTIKGNVKLGMRFFFFTFYPMVPKETFVNAFFFNALLINVWMFSLIQFMVVLFSEYVRKSDISLIFEVQITHMRFYSYFMKYNVFIYILTGIICTSILYFILRPSERINVG
mmetsp:Transcript_1719/g.1627  ORF Transcript_1719/g.1627 Transcript_1719/m.1627 type:complete len:415 (+) Transcript_1719:234-1478(+)